MLKLTRNFLCAFLSLIFFTVNQPLQAATNTKILSTMDMVNHFDRAQTQNELINYLDTDQAQELLTQSGFSKNNIMEKMASLSDSELRDLNNNVRNAQAGGLLVEILLVILIIYLAQRI